MRQEDILKTFGNIVGKLFPELASRTHLPHKARVTAVHGEAGEVRSDGLGSRRYSVDVEPLTPDGVPDPDRPYLLDVPLEVFWTGANQGVFGLPSVGSIVRVAYYSGSAAHPYIDGVVPDGWQVPSVQEGELLVQHKSGTLVRITPEGDVQVQSQGKVTVQAQQDVRVSSAASVHIDAAAQIQLGGGGPPVARVGDTVSTPSGPGVITGGSSKVFSG